MLALLGLVVASFAVLSTVGCDEHERRGERERPRSERDRDDRGGERGHEEHGERR